MSIESNVIATVIFTGDVGYNQSFETVSNTTSPAVSSLVNLASGANTITVPTTGDAVGCIVVPPVSNTNSITLKGVTGDTGVLLNPANPSVIGLSPAVTAFVLTAGATISDVRLIFF